MEHEEAPQPGPAEPAPPPRSIYVPRYTPIYTGPTSTAVPLPGAPDPPAGFPPPGEPGPWPHGHYQADRPSSSGGNAGKVGAAGGIGVLLLKVLSAAKFAGLGLLKFKLLLSLVLNIGIYAIFFGAAMGPLFGIAFATGFVLLILVHEMGHLIAARMEGVKASMPFFVPFMGAAIFLQQHPRDARSEAIIGIGGPITGTLGAIAVYAAALTVGPTTKLGVFFAVLASYGFFINLFNMIPMSPLDGGRILGAVSKWFQVAGLALVGLLVVPPLLNGEFPNFVLLIILFFGGIGTYNRFKHPEHAGYYQVSAAAKAVIGLSYLTLLAILLGGMVAVGDLATANPHF